MPRGFKPITYQLQIQPTTKDATFKGQVKIFGLWTTNGSRIKLDADCGLYITDIKLQCLSVNGT